MSTRHGHTFVSVCVMKFIPIIWLAICMGIDIATCQCSKFSASSFSSMVAAAAAEVVGHTDSHAVSANVEHQHYYFCCICKISDMSWFGFMVLLQ